MIFSGEYIQFFWKLKDPPEQLWLAWWRRSVCRASHLLIGRSRDTGRSSIETLEPARVVALSFFPSLFLFEVSLFSYLFFCLPLSFFLLLLVLLVLHLLLLQQRMENNPPVNPPGGLPHLSIVQSSSHVEAIVVCRRGVASIGSTLKGQPEGSKGSTGSSQGAEDLLLPLLRLLHPVPQRYGRYTTGNAASNAPPSPVTCPNRHHFPGKFLTTIMIIMMMVMMMIRKEQWQQYGWQDACLTPLKHQASLRILKESRQQWATFSIQSEMTSSKSPQMIEIRLFPNHLKLGSFLAVTMHLNLWANFISIWRW